MAGVDRAGDFRADRLAEDDIRAYLETHQHKQLLRFITCGSVDDGKSTLIGRLLYDSHQILEDELARWRRTADGSGRRGRTSTSPCSSTACPPNGSRGSPSTWRTGSSLDRDLASLSSLTLRAMSSTPGTWLPGRPTADAAVILVDARKGALHADP